jgi:hypothetical protein
MNDAYPEGHPRYASRMQISDDEKGERNASTDEDDTAKEAELPTCKAGEKPRVNMCKAAKKKFCKNNVLPKVQEGEEIACEIKPLCSANPGMPVGECYAPGASLAQIRDDEKGERNASTDEDDTAKEAELPTCKAGEKPRVNMCKAAKKKFCKNNVLPKVQEGEEIACEIKPLCSANPGMPVGECYAPGASLI